MGDRSCRRQGAGAVPSIRVIPVKFANFLSSTVLERDLSLSLLRSSNGYDSGLQGFVELTLMTKLSKLGKTIMVKLSPRLARVSYSGF